MNMIRNSMMVLSGGMLLLAALQAAAQSSTPVPPPADVAAPPADAVITASGLASKVITPGTGTTRPTAASTVKVHYSGWTTDGQMFDSSVVRGEPSVFGVSRVIRGWTEGVQMMVKGEKRRFWIPAALAYGDNPRAGAPRGMLVFDVELFDFTTPIDAAGFPTSHAINRSPIALSRQAFSSGAIALRAASNFFLNACFSVMLQSVIERHSCRALQLSSVLF